MRYLLLILLLVGCSTPYYDFRPFSGTDIREINTLVLNSGEYSNDEISNCISEANSILSYRHGVKMKVVRTITQDFPSYKMQMPEGNYNYMQRDAIRGMNVIADHTKMTDYDIAIMFRTGYVGHAFKTLFLMMPVKEAFIDGLMFRHIMTLSLDSDILAHEVEHSLGGKHGKMGEIDRLRNYQANGG